MQHNVPQGRMENRYADTESRLCMNLEKAEQFCTPSQSEAYIKHTTSCNLHLGTKRTITTRRKWPGPTRLWCWRVGQGPD